MYWLSGRFWTKSFFNHSLCIEAVVSRLPAHKQQVFRLCRFEGKSCEEVAITVGVSVASVRDYLKQATRLVRTYVHTAPKPAQTGVLTLLLLAEQLA